MIDMSMGKYYRLDVFWLEGKGAVYPFSFLAVPLEHSAFKQEFLLIIFKKMKRTSYGSRSADEGKIHAVL
jgi:hypothetical protein